MKKIKILVIIFGFAMLLVACSNGSEDQSAVSEDASTDSWENSAQDGGFSEESEEAGVADPVESERDVADSDESNDTSTDTKVAQENRKIIYTADLRIEVSDYQASLNNFQSIISEYGGYVVESTMYEETQNSSTSGYVTARIPQEHFDAFLEVVEEGSDNVLESSVSGQDVTEEYVDLESRLKSKEVVEERLLSFMEQAEETEDLLAISDDLSKVQEEIERITGRMNYLQDKTDMATVSIHLQERNVKLSGVGEEDLNTWEKTQEQFMRSINFLISAFSGIFIFFVGNLPLLLLLGVIGLAVFWIIRKRMNRNA